MIKDWGMELTNRLLPECAKHGNYTQAYIECHVRQITLPGLAPVGTCRIGAANDPAAVVDPLLRCVFTRAKLAKIALLPSRSNEMPRSVEFFSVCSGCHQNFKVIYGPVNGRLCFGLVSNIGVLRPLFDFYSN